MACGSATLDKKGFGTEQIQEELGQLFPDAKVGRMDLDTTRGKFAYEKIISAFENQEMDILVGTQMVTKGLERTYQECERYRSLIQDELNKSIMNSTTNKLIKDIIFDSIAGGRLPSKEANKERV